MERKDLKDLQVTVEQSAFLARRATMVCQGLQVKMDKLVRLVLLGMMELVANLVTQEILDMTDLQVRRGQRGILAL